MKKGRVTVAATAVGFLFSHSVSLFDEDMKCISILNTSIHTHIYISVFQYSQKSINNCNILITGLLSFS